MEQKKVNLALLFSSILFAIGVAIKGFVSYFGGSFGIPFVAVLVMISLAMFLGLSSKDTRKRTLDVLVLAVVSSVCWLIIFCAYDWSTNIDTGLLEFVENMMNFISATSLIFFLWSLFRLGCEMNNKRVKFVEILLGNEKVERTPKEKKQPKEKPVKNLKEVENGDLLDKPNKDATDTQNLNNNMEESSRDNWQPTENSSNIDKSNIGNTTNFDNSNSNNSSNFDGYGY